MGEGSQIVIRFGGRAGCPRCFKCYICIYASILPLNICIYIFSYYIFINGETCIF